MPRVKRPKDNIVTEVPVSANVMTRNILEYLALRGVMAWRNNVGVMRPERNDGRRGFVQFGKRGSGDIIGLMPRTGKFLSIEVKAGRDHLRGAQQDFMDAVNNLGGIAFVARSEQDVIDRLEPELASGE